MTRASKTQTVFLCQTCEYSSPKWLGQCPNCESWNTFVETLVGGTSGRFASNAAGFGGKGGGAQIDKQTLASLSTSKVQYSRMSTGMEEFDRVLGGGIVSGSVTLLGGEPGIGKSTLLTQLVIKILKDQPKASRIYYLCGEENPQQIRLRIDRMVSEKMPAGWEEKLVFINTTDVDAAIAMVSTDHPSMVIVDSIQTMQTMELTGSAGAVGQLKECTQRLTDMAKRLHIPVFLVGHVTKEGTIAGPKVLEHIVDTVLELSGERSGMFRLLRAIKNRFGATDEVGVFQAVDSGLEEVPNPSELFLQERKVEVCGSAVVPLLEGTRVVLIDVQALVIDSQLAMPRRVGRGVSLPKIQLLCAVLQKHCGLPLGTSDVFVNVTGGFTVNDPSADLAVAMAIASSCKNMSLPNDLAYAGEIGLLGEVRRVSMVEKRVREAKKLGFSSVVTGAEEASLRRLVQKHLNKK